MKKLFYNGVIITVNDKQPKATSLLVEDGLITAVGDTDNLMSFKDDMTELIDLQGHTMLPGFIDGHGHICNIITSLPTILPPPNGIVDSKENLIKALSTMVKEKQFLPTGWLIASGYDNAFFENGAHPTRDELDQVSTEIPILIFHASGHVGTANSKALEIAGWDENTPDPEGGALQHDPETGKLNGILKGKAVLNLGFGYGLNGLTIEDQANDFVKTQKFYASMGVTTAQEGGTSPENMDILRYCQSHDMIMLDIVSYPVLETASYLIPDDSPSQHYEKHIKICGAKVVGDGSPQAKTAWLTEPYYIPADNEPVDYKGLSMFSDEQMLDFCRQVMRHNWQLLVHCNGDAMGDQFIRCYQQAKAESGNDSDLRPVMIHAQTVREDQLDQMKELHMMPSFFHDHVFYWGDFHYSSVFGPERGSRISPLYSAQRREIPFTLHNDPPVTPINPIFNIHIAVNRRTRGGMVLGPEYTVDVMEAIRAVTIYGAYQYFDENIKGSLEVGKMADLVILDKNPLSVPKDKIKDITVLETIKEGITIYKK
ncbi:amidohydrolase [Streptococcus sp.]|uniref:amidohydrolase n=1 Tax=Streptococcus sp. TaxID=1306 RepID=UPI003AEF94E8